VQLKLPKVGEDPRGTASVHGWAYMNYEDFARKVRRLNQETEFTKDVMDAAFRKAVSRVASSSMTTKSRINGLFTRVSTQLLPEHEVALLLIEQCSVWAKSPRSTGKTNDV
jgi:hypothetical protein